MIVDKIKSIVSRWKEKKQAEKDYIENERMVSKLDQRKLSHHERVLNTLLEQNRQEYIKKQLDFEIARRRNQDKQKARTMLGSSNKLWKDNSLMKTKNLFKGNKSILK